MRKNEKITALYERLSRDDFGKDDDQQRESKSTDAMKAQFVMLRKNMQNSLVHTILC